MDAKACLGLGVILSVGAWFGGAFGAGSYSREVGASPDAVRAALQDLDIRDAPGEPGTDPMRSGDVVPVFELTEQGNDMVWTVKSGSDVAVRMIAHLEPLDGGTRTLVTTSVERGNAPDDLVAPAFRSTGLTAGLFGMVLEDQLDELTRPPSPGAEACRELSERLLMANAPPPDQQVGFGGVARTAMTLAAVEGELKAAGCDTGFKEFKEVSNEMGAGGGGGGGGAGDRDAARATEGVTFKPGQPMIDVRPRPTRN